MESVAEDKKRETFVTQKDYHAKFKRLKRMVKRQVFLNAALYDEITRMEQVFVRGKAERKSLMKRLFQYLPMTESQVLQSTQALKALENTFPGKIPQSILSPVTNTKDPLLFPQVKKVKKSSAVVNKSSTAKSAVKASPKESCTAAKKAEPEKSGDGLIKPKRKKPGTAVKKVQPIYLDDSGIPLFPITLGTLRVFDLGEILPNKPGFHSERYIWPVGFCSTRLYPSMLDPERRIQYFCYIKDGGSEPVFEIIPEDEADSPITAVTATACHCHVLKRLNKARGKDATNTGSGPEFFGFSHSTIQYLIQCLPGAEACEKYVPLKFDLPSAANTSVHSNTTSPSNVIREDNLPNMKLYDRSKLELPSPNRNGDMSTI